MMQNRHATSLPIYPNVLKPDDLARVREAVRTARTGRHGFWARASRVLLAYEFRWIKDTVAGRRSGPDRFCGNLASGLVYPPALYCKVFR